MLNEVKHLAKFVQTSENINVYIFSASAAELNGIATICLLEKLLGGDKPPFVATDAFIPRRPSARSLTSAPTGVDLKVPTLRSVRMTTDAKPSAEISLLNLCRGAKEENSELLIAENLHFGQLLYYLQN